MKITATTTDADILRDLDAARERLVARINERTAAEYVVAAANDLAHHEGRAAARITYRSALKGAAEHRHMSDAHPEVVAVAKQAVTDLVFAGADDTWSGRNNDGRRARYDGIRDEAQRLIRGW